MGKYLKSICAVLVIMSQLATPFALAQEPDLPVDDANANGGASLWGAGQYQGSGSMDAMINPQGSTAGTDSFSQMLNPQGSQGQTGSQTTLTYPVGDPNSQAAASLGGTQRTSTDGGSVEVFAADAVGCGVGQIMGGIAKAGISAVIGSIKGAVGSVTGSVTNSKVPITNPTLEDSARALQSKEVSPGTTDFAGMVSSLLDGVSFDSIGFCLANATIQYITQSTVNWINSGFEGNPTFVDDPGKFFQDIADFELGAFMEELGVGYLCSPGQLAKIKIALVNDYMNRNGGKTFNDKYKCSFQQIGTNVEAFVNNFQNGGLNAFVEFVYNPASRASTGYLAAQDELSNRIEKGVKAKEFELRATDFLSFKTCDEVSDVKTRQVKKVNCKTYTPGQMIEEQANNAINSPRNRLEIADEFDEVIGALVNQLIKTALSEMTTSTDTNNDDDDDDEETEVVNTGTITYQPGTGNQSTVPGRNARITGACLVSTTTVAVDMPVDVWMNNVRGGNGYFAYDWLGSSNFPTNTSSSRIRISFSTTTQASDIDVRVRSQGVAAQTFQCPAITVTPPVPLEVSCEPDDSSVSINDSVTWESTVSGGTGYYTYEWSGDIASYAKTSQDNTVSYNKKGTYEADLKVTSGSQTQTVSCSPDVRVR